MFLRIGEHAVRSNPVSWEHAQILWEHAKVSLGDAPTSYEQPVPLRGAISRNGG